MTNVSTIDTAVSSGPLTFKKGKDVTDGEVKKFADTVNQQAKTVCDGIVAQLAKDKVKAQVKQGPKGWVILVGNVNEAHGVGLAVSVEDGTTNITITANTADVAPTINALNQFFSSWRTVVGFMATGATIVAGFWAMTVIRRQG